MADLSSRFLGIAVASPFILGASSLGATVSGISKAAQAGAGAVVLKSLFEEQITADSQTLLQQGENSHPEAADWLEQSSFNLQTAEYLELLQAASRQVDIPLIASINCTSLEHWTGFAAQLEQAGARGLELNIALLPVDREPDALALESRIVAMVQAVRQACTLPLGIKLGASYTNLVSLANRLSQEGISSLVLFNRFYQMDIDLEKLEPSPGMVFSNPQDYQIALRWLGILSGRRELEGVELVGSGGIHQWESAAKLILSGASAVQVCSAVYRHGYQIFDQMNQDLAAWMDRRGFANLEAFRGRLNRRNIENPQVFERLQFIKALTRIY